MKVEILAQEVVGARGRFVRGDVVELPEEDANPLIVAEAARKVEEKPKAGKGKKE